MIQEILERISSDTLTAYARTEVTTVLYDVFEPNRIRAALQRSECNLGHLIFSRSSWAAFSGELTSPATDPLTRMFGERGK